MPLTVLYRKNGGQVKAISGADPWDAFPDTFWGKVVDPPFPDGQDMTPPKIWDGTDCRNATQPEIDNFAVARAADENLQARAKAELAVDDPEVLGKVMRSMVKLVVDELNILRRQFNTTTAESNQLTDTTFADRSVAQAKTAIKNDIQSGAVD